jgi:hypothetical protein
MSLEREQLLENSAHDSGRICGINSCDNYGHPPKYGKLDQSFRQNTEGGFG